jgi:hypothetical protein
MPFLLLAVPGLVGAWWATSSINDATTATQNQVTASLGGSPEDSLGTAWYDKFFSTNQSSVVSTVGNAVGNTLNWGKLVMVAGFLIAAGYFLQGASFFRGGRSHG